MTNQEMKAEAATIAGGEQQLNDLLNFGAGLPAERRANLNQRLADPALFKGAISELQREHGQAVEGSDRPSPGVLTNRDEYFRTMRAANNGSVDARERLRRHIQAGGKRFL